MEHTSLPHYWVNHFGFIIRKQLVQDFRRAGHQITAEEWAILLILQGQDAMTAKQVSEVSLRDKTTVSRLIDKMAHKGLVERRKDAVDGRVMHLHLTDHGRATFAELATLAQALIARSVDTIDPGDLATTVLTLSRMAGNLKEKPENEVGNGL